ncbi:MAG: GNAT family N-acetyltransferase [Deltaproteobacteria bacterium]|nr:GNAT family N-acetyltransferase [Deltaproteobacteria bacterium]
MERLEFDSDLFGVRVCRATSMPDEAALRECDLLYLFTRNEVPKETLDRFNGCLADQRFSYTRDLLDEDTPQPDETHQPPFEIVRARGLVKQDRLDLRELAFQSGYRCRFKMDPLMPDEWFRRMYSTWMDNSIYGVVADLVVAARIEGRYAAMATLREDTPDAASIGLIAVDAGQRGTGLGKKLMDEVLRCCMLDLGCTICWAETHGQDPGACAFYEAMGFTLDDRMNVYHLWPNGAPA